MSLGERAAPQRGANPLLHGQFANVLNHGQVAVASPCRARLILPLASLGRRGRCLILFAVAAIGSVLTRCFFASSTEESVLEFTVLAAQQFGFGFKPFGP